MLGTCFDFDGLLLVWLSLSFWERFGRWNHEWK
jgi:hypothetical protein